MNDNVKKLTEILNDDEDYGDCTECGCPLYGDEPGDLCDDCQDEADEA